jgi:hypothetical protein
MARKGGSVIASGEKPGGANFFLLNAICVGSPSRVPQTTTAKFVIRSN